MGNNNSEFKCVFDTGSSWMWIPDIECKDCHNPNNGKNRYSCNINSDCEVTAIQKNLEYSRGKISGYIAKDDVKIGGLKARHTFITAYKDNNL